MLCSFARTCAGAVDYQCRPASLLVLGRPGFGKAPFLGDVARLMSSRPDQGGLGLNVMLLDTTGALAGQETYQPKEVASCIVCDQGIVAEWIGVCVTRAKTGDTPIETTWLADCIAHLQASRPLGRHRQVPRHQQDLFAAQHNSPQCCQANVPCSLTVAVQAVTESGCLVLF
jgi:hypothetical protein